MSTITIRELLSSPALRADRGFNGLFAAYASTQRKSCGRCKKKSDLTACRTLLRSLVQSRRKLLEDTFNIPPGAELHVFCQGTAFGISVR